MADDTRTYSSLRAANIARQAEWDKDEGIDAAYRGNELAGEVGEACNIIKKLERERRGIRGSRSTPERLAEELADVVICTDLIAMGYGIDLDAAVADKFNATSEKMGLVARLDRRSPSGELTLSELAAIVDADDLLRGCYLDDNHPWRVLTAGCDVLFEAPEEGRQAHGDADPAALRKIKALFDALPAIRAALCPEAVPAPVDTTP